MAENRRAGGCLCGAVRFEATVPEAVFGICHCDMCRKWCSGPFEAVHCEGPVEFQAQDALAWYRSSQWGERGFCGTCGTNLFWRMAEEPDGMLGVSVEAFDEKEDFTLQQHIYIDRKPARYDFADDCRRLTEAEFLAEIGAVPEGS